MTRTNLIICTYGGIYPHKFEKPWATKINYDHSLRMVLRAINYLPNQLTQITIVRPTVDSNHTVIPQYYDCSGFDKIKDKIKFVDQENIGASYSQFYNVIYHQDQFDYQIVIEDDYFPCVPNFDQILIDEYTRYHRNDIFLCAGIRRNSDGSYQTLPFNEEPALCVADFSLGILSAECIHRIKQTITYDNILAAMRKETWKRPLYYFQIYQAYLFKHSGIEVVDYCDRYLSIFYDNYDNAFQLFNTRGDPQINQYKRLWESHGVTYQGPLFLPIQIIYEQYETYFYRSLEFVTNTARSDYLHNFQKLSQVLRNAAYLIRELKPEDRDQYLKLLYQLTHFQYENTPEHYAEQMAKNDTTCHVYVIESHTMDGRVTLIGAGSIYKLDKLHNNPVGQIEDVVIDEQYRGLSLGALLVKQLATYGFNEWKCYKIVLNCLPHNIGFYEKCGFQLAGTEMKLVRGTKVPP